MGQRITSRVTIKPSLKYSISHRDNSGFELKISEHGWEIVDSAYIVVDQGVGSLCSLRVWWCSGQIIFGSQHALHKPCHLNHVFILLDLLPKIFFSFFFAPWSLRSHGFHHIRMLLQCLADVLTDGQIVPFCRWELLNEADPWSKPFDPTCKGGKLVSKEGKTFASVEPSWEVHTCHPVHDLMRGKARGFWSPAARELGVPVALLSCFTAREGFGKKCVSCGGRMRYTFGCLYYPKKCVQFCSDDDNI